MDKVVFLTSGPPFPLVGARKIRDAQLIHLLSQRMEVEVICQLEDELQQSVLERSVEALPPNVKLTLIKPDRRPLWKKTIETLKPYHVQKHSSSLAKALKNRAEKGKLLWVSRLKMGQYIPLARKLGYKVVLDEHQVESNVLLMEAFSSFSHWPEGVRAAQTAFYEQRFCSAAHAVVTGAEIDASRLKKLSPKVPVYIIPLAVNSDSYVTPRGLAGSSLLFFGALDYRHNHEALLWFSREIMPRLKASLGAEMPRVIVAGTNAPAEVSNKLRHFGIEMYDQPASLLSLLSDAAVVFFPLRSGRGNRINILEAMAAGRAVVSTGKGADGLILKPTYDISIAEHPDSFTSIILRLLRDPKLRAEMGENAVKTIQDRFDWKDSLPMLDHLLEKLPGLPNSNHLTRAPRTTRAPRSRRSPEK
ncbi:MAG: glycosyltransferase [Methylotenera sp.]|nr:glycosyltransferase [Oligoflexia bacterium]